MKKSGRPKGEGKCRKTIYISQDAEDFLYRISAELGTSVSDYLNALLKEMIYEEGRKER